MTSEEIRKTLKPMADFAPAILRCAEIVEAAEAAEKKLKDLDSEVAEKSAQIKINQTEATRFDGLAKAEQQRYAKTREDMENRMAALEQTVKDARANADKAIAGFNAEVEKKREAVKALNVEIDTLEKRLAKSKQSLEEWAKKNSLKVA